MKEIFEQLPKISLDTKVEYLIDTCFLVWIFDHSKEKDFKKFLEEHDCAITSFNLEEFLNISHKIKDNIRQRARKFFHNNQDLHILELPVHPGEWEKEHEFVRSATPMLDSKEQDTSDAVLLAAAIKTGADVLTRDKHDIFNTLIENFLKEYHIQVLNKLP